MSNDPYFSRTELDRTTFPAWRDGILAAEAAGTAVPLPPRSYPGYPVIELPRLRPRLWPSLDRSLRRRRRVCPLGTAQPTRRQLGRLLTAGHGITGPAWAGPTPSAGGLQAVELYLAVLHGGWLPVGWYHYDRVGHCLARLAEGAGRSGVAPMVPSLQQFTGGSLLWIVVGDGARVRAKYGERGLRFLLLDAGHLMQNLCLVSTSLGLVTVPLGGFYERALARELNLLETDLVLYVGVCGAAGG